VTTLKRCCFGGCCFLFVVGLLTMRDMEETRKRKRRSWLSVSQKEAASARHPYELLSRMPMAHSSIVLQCLPVRSSRSGYHPRCSPVPKSKADRGTGGHSIGQGAQSRFPIWVEWLGGGKTGYTQSMYLYLLRVIYMHRCRRD
jgi:hypothetical protein